ncbi:MAG: class I SAM-dependent methyltransferase, partial [Oscillospiraceae bacterium]|nr:class I SAM-dependent methyltransferase [Oscillospiraceae bacterium]
MQRNENIDGGNAFDWGAASGDYAKYRDIYPDEFYRRILDLGLCTRGQTVLDLGTGTGVLPRNMYRHGAKFVGADISEN